MRMTLSFAGTGWARPDPFRAVTPWMEGTVQSLSSRGSKKHVQYVLRKHTLDSSVPLRSSAQALVLLGLGISGLSAGPLAHARSRGAECQHHEQPRRQRLGGWTLTHRNPWSLPLPGSDLKPGGQWFTFVTLRWA
ncbi:hypothetical protein CB1_000278006 [Camelus ferus]|nr:hypothetical protein CB1_000278006 [Camelus ferus]